MATKTKAEPEILAPKVKTAAQKAKAAANIAAAEARLKQLQAQQKRANELRKLGYIGTDTALLVVADDLDNAAQREQESKLAQQYVEIVLAGPHAARVQKFLGRGLTGTPTKVAMIIRNYLRTQGLS